MKHLEVKIANRIEEKLCRLNDLRPLPQSALKKYRIILELK